MKRLIPALLCCAASLSAQAADPDLVFYNGAVYTVDAARSWAEAVAVTGKRISYVGNNREARALAGPHTRMVDLQGRMLLPGFQDAHAHPLPSAIGLLACALYEGSSAEDYVKIVAECARKQPERGVIFGEGWTMDQFPGGLPDKRLLDEAVPDRPVVLSAADGHSIWLNSKALEMAGITADTPDPVNGRIDRYPGSAEPSGSLQESAMELAMAIVPSPTTEEYRAGLQFAQHYLNQYGVTAVQDANITLGSNDAYDSSAAYVAADRAGELTLRVIGSLWWDKQRGLEQIDELVAARKDLQTQRLAPTTVKMMIDGVLEVHTAAMLEPYIDRKDEYKGDLQIEPALLNRVVTQLDALGFQVHFHAIGDRAIRVAFDAVEAAREANGVRDSRHHISHIQVFDPVDIPRFRELNVVANFQPYWAWADPYITDLTIPKLGPERSRWLYPIGSVMETGAMVAFGSDWSVSTGNPLMGIETAVTRRDPETNSSLEFYDNERIRLHDAIAAYTINSAYVNFLDDDTGSIETGKLADLIVLDRNLFAIPAQEISEAEVLMTLLDGQPVYGDWKLAAKEKSAP